MPPQTRSTTTAANTPAAPVIPPPAVVTAPASLTDSAAKNQNDRDAMEAYKLLSAGKHVEASKIVAKIARRDPKNENLKDLRAQIQTVADTERQRAAPPLPRRGGHGHRPAPRLASRLREAGRAGGWYRDRPWPARQAGRPPSTSPATEMTGGAAAGAPAAAAPPPPPSASAAEVERPAIEASIHEYAKALSSRDLPAVARVRRYTPAEARNWENIFKQFAEYRLIVTIKGTPTVNGDDATIPVEETFAQTAKKGGIQVFSQPRKTEYKLEKIGGKWMLLPPG